MKNLFKSLVAGALLLVGTSVSAGTLYWQVTADAGQDFEEAWLVAENKSTGDKNYLKGVDSDGRSPSSTPITQTALDGYESDAYLFYVEMSNYNDADASYDVVSTGYQYGYGELVSSGYVATGAIDSNTAMTNAGLSNFGSAVPEPSSGLLLLMGGAMLALRRRRQK